MSTEEVRTSRAIRVFLSSTSRDLKEHREEVRRRCAALGYDLLLMEEFGAQDADALGVSLKEVEPCKVFVGVYAHRYGYVPPGFAASVTEMEYEEAKRLDKPRLIFVAEPGYAGHALLSEHRDDYDPAVAAKIEAFLRRVGQERVLDTFTTPQHLAGRIVFALSKWEAWRPPLPPPPVHRYVGRAELLAETRRSLQDSRRVALLGVGGIGKTLTAQHLAQTLCETFMGGILWVNFGPESNDPEMLLDATMRGWAQHHHPGRLTNTDELNPNLVRNWLADVPGKLLIVFDDIWHAKPARTLLSLIPANATLLLSTRRADIAHQLDVETQHEINRLSDAEGLAMLRDRVGDIPSQTALRNIVKLLDGHPLALEIVAAQIEQNGPDYAEELPSRLMQNLERGTELSLLRLEAETRQSSVEAALELSYDIMSQDLKRRFRALGVVAPNAAMRPLILAAVWGVKGDEPEALEDATNRMDALVSSGVLSREPGKFLYDMHGLLRAYARALLLATGEGDEAEDRYGKTIVVVSEDSFNRPPEEWRALDIYLPHIHYLGDQLTRQIESLFGDLDHLAQPETATLRTNFSEQERLTLLKGLNFTAAIRNYISNRPQTGESGRRWLQAGLVAARSLKEPIWISNFLSDLGLWHSRRGRPEFALSYYEQALPLTKTANDPPAESLVLNKMALVYSGTGRYQKALALYERIIDIERAQGNQLNEAINMVSMGMVYRQMGQPQQALVLYRQALPVLVEAPDLLHAAVTLNNIGLVYRLMGQLAQALESFQQALMLQRQGGDCRNEAITLENMAGVHWDMWQIDQAASLYERALVIKREIGDLQGEARTLVNIGTVYQKAGQYAEAMQRYTEALPVLRTVVDPAGQAGCLNNIGAVYILSGQPQSALPFLEEALALNRELGNRLGEAKVLNLLGDAYYGLRQTAPAESFYQQALTLSREVGDHPGEAQILQNLGVLYHALGVLDQSLAMYEQALQTMRAVGNRNGEAVTLNNMASLFYAMKQPHLSIQFLEISLGIMQEIGDERGAAAISRNIEELRSLVAASQITPPSDAPSAQAVLLHFLQADKVTQVLMAVKYRSILLTDEVDALMVQFIANARATGDAEALQRSEVARSFLTEMRRR